MFNLILLGPQGSGKSTQAKLLVDRLLLQHIDMGASLRSIAKEDSELGRRVNDIINVRKELVSDALVAQILKYVIGGVNEKDGVILDGAPRKETQITVVEEVFSSYRRNIDKVIFINLPKELSISRIASRFACSECLKPYIILQEEQIYHSFSCNVCGGKLEQRIDDTPEGVKKRLEVFHSETKPVIEHYESEGKLLKVDGSRTVEEIHQDILRGLQIIE